MGGGPTLCTLKRLGSGAVALAMPCHGPACPLPLQLALLAWHPLMHRAAPLWVLSVSVGWLFSWSVFLSV